MASCFCNYLHRNCDVTHCSKAGDFTERRHTLGQLLASGCFTCETLIRGLTLPEIQPIWKQQGWTGAPDESKLQLEWAPGTSFLRTWAADNGFFWRHFAFSHQEDSAQPQNTRCSGFQRESDHIIPYTGSPAAFAKIREWLDECDKSHNCLSRAASNLPDRVVKVSGNMIKVEPGSGRQALYTTLSHCWGGESPVTLLASTLPKLTTEGLPVTELPKTFQDFTAITRQLGIEYVWLDSLCIIQDDKQDWERQSTRMHTVYGNSFLNIAAKHAANCHEGCFAHIADEPMHRRYRIPGTDVFIRVVPRETHHDHAVHHRETRAGAAPLLKRGWVLQERLLAPRTIYFDRHELLWECMDSHKCQCGAMGVFIGFKDYWTASLRAGERRHLTREHPVAAWMKVLTKYTAMQFTFERDRLVALDGIASQLRATSRMGNYVAGMWRDHLERQLTWCMVDGFAKNPDRLAPSWSWASRVGNVHFEDAGNWMMAPWDSDEAQIMGISPWDEGSQTGGELEVQSRAIDVWADVVQNARMDRPATFALSDVKVDGILGNFVGDVIDLNDEVGCRRRLLLLWWGFASSGTYNYLVLAKARRIGIDRTIYERFGLLSVDYEEHKPHLTWMSRENPTSYVII